MRLEKTATPGANAICVPCCQCGKMFTLSKGWADLDGKTFHAYYCDLCASQLSAPRSINGFKVETLLERSTCPSRSGGNLQEWEWAQHALHNYNVGA